MTICTSSDAVIVSCESLDSTDPRAVIDSSISFVNALQRELLRPSEISRQAYLSYYVDYYLVQIENGGFSQFVYNSKWNAQVVEFVREGLKEMGSTRHLELFDEGASKVTSLGGRIRAFFASSYFGRNIVRDGLDGVTDRFFLLNKTEDLVSLNDKWLRGLKSLQAIPRDEMPEAVAVRAAAVPDREKRDADVRANEPLWLKQIRALCAATEQRYLRATAADSFAYEGKDFLAYHFVTEKGHHFMIEANGSTILFNGETEERLAAIPALRH